MTYDAIYMVMETDSFEISDPSQEQKRLKWGEEPIVKKEIKKVAPQKTRIRVLELKWESEISYENSVYKKGYSMNNLFF